MGILGLKVGRMLRLAYEFKVLGAGVMQLASAMAVGTVLVLSSFSHVRAGQACASAEQETVNADAASGEGWACGEDTHDLDLSLPASDAAAALPAPRKEVPVALPPDASASGPLPVVITPAETGAGARASLQTLRAYNASKTAKKADEARAAAPEAVPILKGPVAPKSAFDIWSSIDAQGFDSEAGRTVRTGAGLDYKVVRNTSIGVVAERSQVNADGMADGAATGEKVSAYVAFKAAPALTIDARTQWERAQTLDRANATGTETETSSVVVAPRLGKAFSLEGGETLEPYLEVKREIGLSEADTLPQSADSAGAGLNFNRPGSYAVNVTTDVQGLGSSEPASLNSKVQLKVPLQ